VNNYSRRTFIGDVAAIAGTAGPLRAWGRPVAGNADSNSPKSIKLHNENMTVFVDSVGGQITRIRNNRSNEIHEVQSVEFSIVSDRGTWSSRQMAVTRIEQDAQHLTLSLEGGAYRATIHYQLGVEWLEKWVEFSADHPMTLKRMVMGDRRYLPLFKEVQFHSDNTAYNVPICWFLRSVRGGLYTGIEFPFSAGEYRDGRLGLSYGGWSSTYDFSGRKLVDMVGDRPSVVCLEDMNVALGASQRFVTEKEFIGVFQRTGYVRKKALTGVPRILTTTEERLDWGEVWAMQRFMRHVLPPLRSSQSGFELYMNGWWAGLPGDAIAPKNLPDYRSAIDECVTLGVGVFSFPPTWLGMARYVDRSAPFVETVGKDHEFSLSPAAQEAVEYVQSSGMTLAPYCEGSSYYRKDRPDWKTVTETRTQRGQLCWANSAAIDWFRRLHQQVFEKYPVISYWNWDGGFLPGDPEDAESLVGEQPLSWECHSDQHGHPPGNVSYRLYKNVMSFFHVLRTECPRVATIAAWAVKCGGPWALRHIDSHENFYENQGPDDLRFQMWYNQNSSFLPCEKNMAQIWFTFRPAAMQLPEKSRDYWKMWFTDSTRDYEYGLMSALSGGVDLGFLVQLPHFDSAEARNKYVAFVAKWKKWATENLDCLKVKRDLFGQPLRAGGIDGSAHILDGRGFIFLFNPTAERHIGRIPADWRIFLNAGRAYEVKTIYPDEGQSLGSYAYGSDFSVDLSAGSCKVVEIQPYDGPPLPMKIPEDADIQDAF
jgi:hypothetical protein